MIGVAVLFILLGLLVKHGKMYFLLAGYNTLSKQERETYDIERVARLFRNTMLVMAFIIIVGYFLAEYTTNPNIKNYSFWISIILGVPYLLLQSNSKKFRKTQ